MLIYLQMIETPEDEDKFTEIYEAYLGLAHHVALGHMKNEHDARDVVHHVFMKIAENIKNVEPVSPKTKQYIVTMIDNRAIDVFRVRNKHPVDSFNDELDHGFFHDYEGGSFLMECILKLPAQQRTVILLKYKYGYSLREIATMLKISLTWAQKIDQRAKKKLEELYKEGGGNL